MSKPLAVQNTIVTPNINVFRVALAIFILAGAGLAFQVALTRVFSLMFQYHYVFVVVSIATLGLGIGAAVGYLVAREHTRDMREVVYASLTLALLFPVCAWLLTVIHAPEVTLLVLIVALVPFLLIGWINAFVYTRYAKQSNMIYGADLVGAAGGLILGPSLITYLGPYGTIIALGIGVSIAALLLASTRQIITINGGVVILLALFVGINYNQSLIAYDPTALDDAPPDKTMVHILNDRTQGATIIDTQWSPFAQVDVMAINDESARFVFTDAGAGSIMLRYDSTDDPSTYAWIKEEIAYFPFNPELGSVSNTLIIGAGAGYDVVIAEIAGAETITAVEINPAIVNITRKYADYNGGIFDLPNVTTVITDGRNFIDRSDDQFDLIYLNFVYSQAARPGTSALSENYAFTTEALRAYWDRLSADGRIGFVTHNSVEGLRLMMTALQALEEEGLSTEKALSHMVLMYQPNPGDPTVTPSVLLIKRSPWTEEEILLLTQPALMGRMEPQYIPYVWEDFFTPLDAGTISLSNYVDAYADHDISPTTDNQPFFYHLDKGLPKAISTLLLVSALLTFGYFIVSATTQPHKPSHEWTRATLLIYFALLGAGFMLAEVTLLQYFKLLLGDPIRAFSVALSALLIGGGLGSWFSQRYSILQLPNVIRLVAVGTAFWLLITAWVYPTIITQSLPASLFMRTMITMVLLIPLGFLMGIPFPSGLRIASNQDAIGIPLFWGMNAVASTLGGTLASVVALTVGFQITLLLSAVLYLCVAGLVHFTWAHVLALRLTRHEIL